MIRRRLATASLALATLFGGSGPAAADAGPRRQAPQPELWRGSPGIVAAQPLRVTPTHARPTHDGSTPRRQWSDRIESRFSALASAGETHAAERPAEADASDELLDRLQQLAAGLDDEAALGIAVRELSTGAPVFEWDASRSLNPASNHKLLTATAALELLGDDYRFETRVLREGDTLIIVGQGDPSLQLDDLEALATQVATATDLHTIDKIIVDDTAFSSRRFGPGYDTDGPGVSYMAPSGALSLQFNTVEIRVRGAAEGHPLSIEVSPPSAHVDIRTTAVGGRGGLSVQTWADGEQTVVDVRGHLRKGEQVNKRRRITDPGRFAGSVFGSVLERHGAAAIPVEFGTASKSAAIVATHRSEPLPLVLESALAYSNNFTTEQLLRTIGWRMTGEPGDWDNGRVALLRYWEAAGLHPDDLTFENASGLSVNGRITAAALADLLAFAAREGSPASALWGALPIAGREGTLRGRLRHCGGRVRAKTGTLRGASALSGVVEAKDGRRLGFSILVNGPVSARRSHRLQDKVVMALVKYGAAH